MTFSLKHFILGLITLTVSLALFFLTTENNEMLDFAFCLLNFIIILSLLNNYTKKNNTILYFLVLYLVASVAPIIPLNFNYQVEFSLANFGTLLAYISLIIMICKQNSLKALLYDYKEYFVVLSLFAAFIIYYMSTIMHQSNTIKPSSYPYILDTINNVTIVILLMLSFINFLKNDSKKDLFLLVICSLFIFSDVVQIIHFYAAKYDSLFNLFSTLKLVGFIMCFYYIHLKQNILFRIAS